MNTVGSVWRKWDLHVHTPASYQWKGQRFEQMTSAERDASCKSVLEAMNKSDADAFCIMDYWTFDGYLTLREFLERHPEYDKKQIFPGMEFRLEAPTNYRLNAHVLLSDKLPVESLNVFLTHLKFSGPNSNPPLRPHFIQLGRSYDAGKLTLHGFKLVDKSDDDKMRQLGMMTAELSRDSLDAAITQIGKENCLFILPYDTNDGVEDLAWKCHPYADSTLMKWADCFETRQQIHVDLFLGKGHPKKPQIGIDFLDNLGGLPKPVFSGSDAHQVAHYAVYPSGRATWLKAQPTFKGLKQICHEPALRCHIGDTPPKLQHIAANPTKYMTSLVISKHEKAPLDEHWFDGKEIALNPGLVAIIGNKGSGKSALADILALAGNSHCPKMEFLNDERFRKSSNKAQHFTATLTWGDGSTTVVKLRACL